MRTSMRFLFGLGLSLLLCSTSGAQETKTRLIPHAQDEPPNDPRDAMTAAKLMTVPEGFTVEVVASEPDLVNPVAMTIDERGRFWVTESLEYPRREPGPGQDRVKILEDTDGDGKADKVTVFLDGLNIPSGIAVGHGGVWVANAPDILFVQDTDGDGKADKQEVVVTGFGRTDTHELPNSLTWGPDGWLYGLNGVFNHSHVRYSPTNPNFDAQHPGWPLTCALFRIHPRTREFQVFSEGTSNPWGIAFNDEGEAFVSACVIDHLWHLVETGYYHRQGGPYPPFTWKIESIVKHKHQKAAYCGIHFLDSDAYPEQYRRKLYMGNIHGGCINVDRIQPNGSTYEGFGEPDFLTANDAWFMPVVQKTGPDGSLYVLDWYDQYHCYQDANRDPAGLDRLKGRLYRVRYKETPRVSPKLNLAAESDDELIQRLGAGNDFLRDTARRILQERNSSAIATKLLKALTAPQDPNVTSEHRHRLFMTLCGLSVSETEQLAKWSRQEINSTIRSWQLRFLGDHPQFAPTIDRFSELAPDAKNSNEVLQYVIAAAKRSAASDAQGPEQREALFRLYLDVLANLGEDTHLSRIIWQNLHPKLEASAEQFVTLLEQPGMKDNAALISLMPRIIDRMLGRQTFDAKVIAGLIAFLAENHPETAALGLQRLSTKVQNRELTADHLAEMKQAMEATLQPVLHGKTDSPMYLPAAFLATSWNDPIGIKAVRQVFVTDTGSPEQRLLALNSLITIRDEGLLAAISQALDSKTSSSLFKSQLFASLSKHDDPRIAAMILERFDQFDPELQTRAVELLTQRASWAKDLLRAMGDRKVPSTTMNVNQARRLNDLKDEELSKLLTSHWGQVREGRDPNRDRYIAEMRQLIRRAPGDPFAGEKAFKKICAQCHKIYGEGAEVGPDITLNGRNNFEQLLSNVFDPSLVIGAGYRSYTVVTNSGRVLNGLLVEDSPQRIVLKVQGGKQEVVPRSDIDELNVNEISLMPEQIEKQLSATEIVDLFAFLSLDKHPSDKSGRLLAGAGEVIPKETLKPAEFGPLIHEILPGFNTTASGELGIGVLKEHRGRIGVLRTHPVSAQKPCVLSGTFAIPAGVRTTLMLDVSHDPRGDWRLQIKANGDQILRQEINAETCPDGWATVKVDLSKFAGREIRLELLNTATGWSYEFGYWGGLRWIHE
ncbi:PVC-type heme-binding CxxCH protein [Schlesneria sp. T3-172]|uniref:PVC-type heme-binding CxxCH protein n=1 Tax=Schlesneria sphaerica TaxID=3373610 RepID=UPI0037C599B3